MDPRVSKVLEEAKKAVDSGDWKTDALSFSKETSKAAKNELRQIASSVMSKMDALLTRSDELFSASNDPAVQDAMDALRRKQSDLEKSFAELHKQLATLQAATERAAEKYGI